MSAKYESPFRASWENMFGCGLSEDKSKNTEEVVAIVVHDTRPETLRETIANNGVNINLSICRIISEYVSSTPGPLTFEIWKYAEDPADSFNANWYGQMTYGTCWFRGSKIWLTPEAGTTVKVRKPKTGEDHVCLQAYRHWQQRRRPENKYDTKQFPFRTGSPRELIRDMKKINSYAPNVEFKKAE